MGFVMMIFKTRDRNSVIAKALNTIGPIASYLGQKEFLVGNSLTFVDILLWETCETILGLCQDTRLFTAHPNLQAHHGRIRSIPAFAQYIASDKCYSDFYNPSPPISMFPILAYYH